MNRLSTTVRILTAAVLLSTLALAPSPARADEASKRAKVQEMFTLLHLDANMKRLTDSLMQQVRNVTARQLEGSTLTPDQQQKVDDFQKKAFELVEKSTSWPVVEPDYVSLYAETYSESEIDGILAFYKSPVGQSLLAKTPELTTKSIAISQKRVAALMPQLQALATQLGQELKPATPPAATTPTPNPTPTPAPKK